MVRKVAKKVVRTEEQVVVETICNKCGHTDKDIKLGDEGYRFISNFDLGFGYGSKYDLENWKFDLCDSCLEDIVSTFKHVPSGFKQGTYCFTENESEEHQKLFENWKATGEWDTFKYKTYEELKELRDFIGHDFLDNYIKKRFPDKHNK